MNKSFLQIIAVSVVLHSLAFHARTAQVSQLTFKGKASGGALILGRLSWRDPRYVSLETSPGESPESVAERLAQQITANHTRADCPEVHRLWWGAGAVASGSSVTLGSFLADFYLGGTEVGLGIPERPVFLTCVYDSHADELRLQWENPHEGYDKVFVSLEWQGRGGTRTVKRSMQGHATTFAAKRKEIYNVSIVDVNDLFVAVVGFRDGIMSAPAAMHLSGHYQDEAFAIPFAQGVMTNWRAWARGKGQDIRRVAMAQHYKTVNTYFGHDGLDAKPFFQVIKADPSGAVGIYRKFLGLTPGHTYRITAALSNRELEMNPRNEWSFSVHAAPESPGGKGLTVEQLAGESPLSNGRKGPGAGRVIASGRLGGQQIGGNWTGQGFRLLRSKPQTEGLTSDGTDVTLPDGVDTLIVWVRFECSDPNAEVGFMGVGLEDVTATREGQARPKEESVGPKKRR